jgi:hypothetical protein
MLFLSTKNPGAYIIRLENSQLAEKLARKAKDTSTKNFLQSLMLPRKLKFKKSMFFLDFFHVGSWNLTSTVPQEKIKGIIIVKRTPGVDFEINMNMEEEEDNPHAEIPKTHYIDSVDHMKSKVIFIHSEGAKEGYKNVSFPFIKKEEPKSVGGVTIREDIDWDNISE